jgi:hypothetical protein
MIKTKNHNERQDDELFLTNTTYDDYYQIGWKTKRQGDIAYDVDGEEVKGLFPVFIKKFEVEAEGMGWIIE